VSIIHTEEGEDFPSLKFWLQVPVDPQILCLITEDDKNIIVSKLKVCLEKSVAEVLKAKLHSKNRK